MYYSYKLCISNKKYFVTDSQKKSLFVYIYYSFFFKDFKRKISYILMILSLCQFEKSILALIKKIIVLPLSSSKYSFLQP